MSKARRRGQVAKEKVDGVGGRHPSAAGLDYRDGGMVNGRWCSRGARGQERARGRGVDKRRVVQVGWVGTAERGTINVVR